MRERQEKILKYIVKEYIRTAEPVSSGRLSEKYSFNLCSATLRLDMRELTKEGYLLKPHISAGRVPTEKAYRFFVEEFCEPRLSPKIEKRIEKIFFEEETEKEILREIGKMIAMISRNVSILLKREEIFWQGLSYLLSQPEFYDPDEILEVIESFENLYENLREKVFPNEEIKIYIGRENPFMKDEDLSLILGGLEDGMIGILGPKRMDYQKNIALIKRAQDLIGERF